MTTARCLAVLLPIAFTAAAFAQVGGGRLLTRWSEQARTVRPHAEHPRPILVREAWRTLNGDWQFALAARDAGQPDFDRTIRVPFCVESALSGVGEAVSPEQRMWYRRSFEVPDDWRDGRLLLHFEAVDHEAEIWLNGQRLGEHAGGYDAFSFDITEALREDDEQELVLAAWDPTDTGNQPRGKQVLEPRGIWYTAVSGIWQPVWLEHVPETYIEEIRIFPRIDPPGATLHLPVANHQRGDMLLAIVKVEGEMVAASNASAGQPLSLRLPSARLWSPEEPFLYDLDIAVIRDGETIDRAASYFGLREVSLVDGEHGAMIALNGQPLFQIGLLDQGWWPDGLYTPPTDEAMVFDIQTMKDLGFNMLRQHVKVAPRRWYTHCDRIGMLVWQDMPSGDDRVPRRPPDHPEAQIDRSPESAAQFELELKEMIEQLQPHPSIVVWVPFNEGWGQYDTAHIARWVKELDPTRLVDSASGWNDMGVGDMHDIHVYPGPAMPDPEPGRAAVLGEFGGLGLPIPGHLWNKEGNWGYRTLETREELEQGYAHLIEQLRWLLPRGLSAAIYTQVSDVEGEVNGLLTYDREVLKVDAERMQLLHASLAEPVPDLVTIAPTSEEEPATWRFTLEAPPEDWQAPGFDDSSWQQGPGGFGTERTPGAVVGTEWSTGQIWLRRTFRAPDPPDRLALRIHHDEDAEVYLNGQRIASFEGYTTDYIIRPLGEAAAAALREGENVLAIHCRQTRGGQFIDCGLLGLTPR